VIERDKTIGILLFIRDEFGIISIMYMIFKEGYGIQIYIGNVYTFFVGL